MNIGKVVKGEFSITITIMVISLFLYSVFRVEGDFQRVFTALSFLFILPVLYIRLILKKSLRDFGFKIGDWRKGIKYGIISFVIVAVILGILFWKFNFVEKYFLPVSAIIDFKYFVIRELFIIGFFIALYEFFFRGFVMFYFLDKIKYNYLTNLIQIVSFYLFLFAVGTFDWPRAPYLLLAPFAGWIAQKSDSILYSFLFTWISFLILDSVFVKLIIQQTLTQ